MCMSRFCLNANVHETTNNNSQNVSVNTYARHLSGNPFVTTTANSVPRYNLVHITIASIRTTVLEIFFIGGTIANSKWMHPQKFAWKCFFYFLYFSCNFSDTKFKLYICTSVKYIMLNVWRGFTGMILSWWI